MSPAAGRAALARSLAPLGDVIWPEVGAISARDKRLSQDKDTRGPGGSKLGTGGAAEQEEGAGGRA